MIFASDLDRTLVFSQRFLDELGDTLHKKHGKIVEETSTGTGMIYEPMDVFLEHMNRSNCDSFLFIPCTARTEEQYKRIEMRVNPEYAVVENGCVILDKYGEPVMDYHRFIRSTLCIDLFEATRKLHKEVSQAIKLGGCYDIAVVKQIKDSYVLVQPLERNKHDMDKIVGVLRYYFASSNYSEYKVSVDKWKIYITHAEIDKSTALKWIAKRTWENNIIAAGDTTMDEDMLNVAEYAIIPEHATLVRKNIHSKIIEVPSGMEGTQQMILRILECISEFKNREE